jgi:hypothetical protein
MSFVLMVENLIRCSYVFINYINILIQQYKI